MFISKSDLRANRCSKWNVWMKHTEQLSERANESEHIVKKSRRQQQQQQQPLMRIKCGKKRHECLWHLLTFCAANLQLWWQFLLLFALLPIEIAQVHSQLWANRKIIEKKILAAFFSLLLPSLCCCEIHLVLIRMETRKWPDKNFPNVFFTE